MTFITEKILLKPTTAQDAQIRQKMNIVIIGHVDHGKSTLVGRLLADTDSLPKGKLQEVQARCARNAKPFEYAFLLDALKDEQSQGITIDSARCFFHSAKREYILIDAPGHIEFLKNMISGAARAEAAVLVIDAKEGVQENSRRHGYLLGMLGVRQVAVCVNKMDLVDYSQDTFESIRREYSAFLSQVGIEARHFIPIAAREGVNIASHSEPTSWYAGPTVLEALDSFEKEPSSVDKPLRFPIQDIYKFTEQGDDRRILAGRIETGSVRAGDEVVFQPSGKRSRIAGIEVFNADVTLEASAGQSAGFTLTEQIYLVPGEIMSRADQDSPHTASQIRVNLFWLGREPMVYNKRYILKLATAKIPVWLRQIHTVLDASDLTTETNRKHIERHDVAECALETLRPVAFDLSADIAQTGRFVIIDNYHIAGGGVILDTQDNQADLITEHVRQRQANWWRSKITPDVRAVRFGHRSTLVVLCGPVNTGKWAAARKLEEKLFAAGRMVYYLGLDNSLAGINSDLRQSGLRDEFLRRLGETAHLFTDAGLILVTSVSNLDEYELKVLKTLNSPGETVVVGIGQQDIPDTTLDLRLEASGDPDKIADQVTEFLTQRNYLPEYYL
jgi:bifunctional enzyme CysN/CysC